MCAAAHGLGSCVPQVGGGDHYLGEGKYRGEVDGWRLHAGPAVPSRGHTCLRNCGSKISAGGTLTGTAREAKRFTGELRLALEDLAAAGKLGAVGAKSSSRTSWNG